MIKPTTDRKSNMMAIFLTTTESNETFAVPEELHQIRFHKDTSKTTVYNLVKNHLEKINQVRKV